MFIKYKDLAGARQEYSHKKSVLLAVPYVTILIFG